MDIKIYNCNKNLCEYPLILFFVDLLEKKNYNVTIVNDIKDNDNSLYFILFINTNKAKNYIVYNFEYNQQYIENKMELLKNAKEVWDYSLFNIGKYNIKIHKFVPYLPLNIIDNFKKYIFKNYISKTKEINFLFYGQKNKRREDILNQMNVNIKKIGYNWGELYYNKDLFKLLGKTKYVINIHFYDEGVIEIYRIIECLLLGITVISESGYIDEIYRKNLTNLIIVDNIVDYINNLN